MKKFMFGLLLICLILTGCTTQEKDDIDQGKYFPSGEDKPIEDNTNPDLKDKEISGADLDNDNYVRWIGRTQYKDNARFMYYTGTGFEIRFKGTSVVTTFNATNTTNTNRLPYFYIMVDGEVAPSEREFHLSSPSETVTLISGLSNEEHVLQVIKRSEAYDSTVSVLSIKTDGTFYKVKEKTGLKIQLLGASGMSGFGALGNPGEGRTTANSSSLHAFGYLTARMFDADFQFIANSGAGIKWGNGTNMRTAYDYVGLDTNLKVVDELWDHSSWVPDVLICNIGGNDFTSYVNNLSDQSKAKTEFREAVVEFLTHVHSLYPDLKIIWTHTSSSNGAQAEAAISDYSKRSLVKVVIIPKVGSDGDPEGASNHNSVYTHIRAANILAEAVTELTGIKPVRENITWPN